MIRRAIILDTETDGLPPGDKVLEVAGVLYSVEHATILSCASTILPASKNEAEYVNAIPVQALRQVRDREDGPEWWRTMCATLGVLAADADVAIAHRAEFDERHFKNGAFLSSCLPEGMPWLCSKYDFTWPKQIRPGDGLINLALSHGIGVGVAHRALSDCLLIAELFNRMPGMGIDLQELFAAAMIPRVWVVAQVSFNDKQRAKDAGFQWHDRDARNNCFCGSLSCPISVKKKWARRMTETQAKHLSFPWRFLNS